MLYNSRELPSQLKSLCARHQVLDPSEQTKASIQALRRFMETHEIRFLGGCNSKNFLVTNTQTQEKEVLKVENRLNMPKNVEAHLRSRIPECFIVTYAEQPMSFTRGGIEGRSLLVTEYSHGGDLLAHASTFKNNPSPEAIVERMSSVFQQMSTTMLKIQAANCFFPDAKITNWLIDDNNSLRIADTKSLVFTNSKGIYSEFTPGNERFGLLQTRGYMPPEYSNYVIKADSAHAFILGVNLAEFFKNIPGVPYDKIVAGEAGKALQTLITALTKPNAEERMSLLEANNHLFEMANPDFNSVFAELRKFKMGASDSIMEHYIFEKQLRISKAENDPEAQEKILDEVKNMVNALKNNKALNEINTIVADFKAKASRIYTYGMRIKATTIEEAMAQMPIEERLKLEKSTHAATEKVMEALAAKRTINGVKEVKRTATQAIDEQNAASTFKSFKAKFRTEIPAPNAAKKEVVEEADNQRTLQIKQ